MNSPANPSPPALDYATPSTDEPVLFNLTKTGSTVVIHDQARRMRVISDAIWSVAGIILIGGCVYLGVFGLGKTLIGIVSILTLVGLVAWARSGQVAEPLVIELTASNLIFLNLNTNPPLAIPRDRIYAIEYVPRLKILVVRANGYEVFEHQFSLPAKNVEEIATFLRLELNLKSENETRP